MIGGWEDGSSEASNEASALRAPSSFSRKPSFSPTAAPKVDPDGADPDGSNEDRFWAHANALQAKGVPRSMVGKLSKLLAGDYERGVGMLEDTLAARGKMRAYLAKIIRNIEDEEQRHLPRRQQVEQGVPAWVVEARDDGENIRREGRLWRWGFSLYSDSGEQVGM